MRSMGIDGVKEADRIWKLYRSEMYHLKNFLSNLIYKQVSESLHKAWRNHCLELKNINIYGHKVETKHSLSYCIKQLL